MYCLCCSFFFFESELCWLGVWLYCRSSSFLVLLQRFYRIGRAGRAGRAGQAGHAGLAGGRAGLAIESYIYVYLIDMYIFHIYIYERRHYFSRSQYRFTMCWQHVRTPCTADLQSATSWRAEALNCASTDEAPRATACRKVTLNSSIVDVPSDLLLTRRMLDNWLRQSPRVSNRMLR